MKEQDNAVVDGFVKDAVEFNLLKYAAGQAIFCPGCGDVMDCRRTVIVTVYGKGKDGKEVIAKQWTQCAACWEARRLAFEEGLAKAKANMPKAEFRAEIVDGRESRFDAVDA